MARTRGLERPRTTARRAKPSAPSDQICRLVLRGWPFSLRQLGSVSTLAARVTCPRFFAEARTGARSLAASPSAKRVSDATGPPIHDQGDDPYAARSSIEKQHTNCPRSSHTATTRHGAMALRTRPVSAPRAPSNSGEFEIASTYPGSAIGRLRIAKKSWEGRPGRAKPTLRYASRPGGLRQGTERFAQPTYRG